MNENIATPSTGIAPHPETTDQEVGMQPSRTPPALKPKPLSQEQMVKDLTKEKTLFQVWWAGLRIPHSKTNLLWSGATALILSAYAIIFYLMSGKSEAQSIIHFASQSRAWSEFGFNFSATTLGFLIAGFTVFASLGRPEMFRQMATIEHNKTKGFSSLKDGFFRLLRTFAEFWAFLLFCMGFKLLAHENGALTLLTNLLNQHIPFFKLGFWAVSYVLLGTGLVYVVFSLQAFIYNIHHLVMTGLRFDLISSKENDEDS